MKKIPGDRKAPRFGILLHVRDGVRYRTTLLAALLGAGLALAVIAASQTTPQSAGTPANHAAAQSPAPTPRACFRNPANHCFLRPLKRNSFPAVVLSTVVLDPAHGGVDLGARGTEGIRESEVVLVFAAEVRKALEAQGPSRS